MDDIEDPCAGDGVVVERNGLVIGGGDTLVVLVGVAAFHQRSAR